MLCGVEILPLRLNFLVHFQFGVAFGIFEPVFHKRGNKVGKQERVNAFVHIFGFNRDEHEVNNIVAAIDCFEQVVPSEWEEFAIAFAQCPYQTYGRTWVWAGLQVCPRLSRQFRSSGIHARRSSSPHILDSLPQPIGSKNG